jgi:kynurenine formamidase
MNFNGPQPNTYGVERSSAKAYESGSFIGDTRRGGSCNFEQYTLVPHCNGTHTECIGHITAERKYIIDHLRDILIPCTLVSVEPEDALGCGDTYPVPFNSGDKVISRKLIEQAITGIKKEILNALVIRTIPNPEEKKSRDYGEQPPAFFTPEAMQFILDCGVKHLLTDLPSVDRLFDEGKLGVHRVFWKMKPGASEPDENSNLFHTITEMIFAGSSIQDGRYLLNLQIAPFVADASPSRPVLIPFERAG